MSTKPPKESFGLEPLIPLKTALSNNFLPMGESTYYAGVACGRLPPPTKIGKNNFLTPTQINEIRASYNPIVAEHCDD